MSNTQDIEEMFEEAMKLPFDSKDIYEFNKQLEILIEKYKKGDKIESSKT